MIRAVKGSERLIPSEYCYHRNTLSEKEKEVYDTLAEALSRRKNCSTPIWNIHGADMAKVRAAILHDQPLLYYCGKQSWMTSGIWGPVTIFWDFSMTEVQIEQYDHAINHVLELLTVKLKKSTLWKEIYLHDKLRLLKIEINRDDDMAHTIIGPLLQKHTVCEGIAKLFLLLCAINGIQAAYISGTADGIIEKGPHAWNLIKIGNDWFHVDAYWDLIGANHMGDFCYDYLNLTDQEIGVNHLWNRSLYPNCSNGTKNYFAITKSDIRNASEFQEFVKRCQQKNKKQFEVRMRFDYDLNQCIRIIEKIYPFQRYKGLSYVQKKEIGTIKFMLN